MAFQVPNGSGSLDRSKLVFDMIAIRKSRGGFNLIDVETFLRIPLSERVALVQDDKVRFLSGEEIVPVRGALLSLEAARRGAQDAETPQSPTRSGTAGARSDQGR